MALDNFGNILPARVLTADIYWAAQHKVVRDTMIPVMGQGDAAWTAGQKLAIEGYVIDPSIMVLGWPPELVMATRLSDKLAFTQSLNREPMPGRIKSSIDADDYPPIDQPPPVTPTPANTYVEMVDTKDNQGNTISSVPLLLWTMGALNYFAPGYSCFGPHGIAVVNGKQYVNIGDGVTYTADVREDMAGLWRVFMTTAAA